VIWLGCFLLLSIAAATTNPGLKLRLSQKGLDYGASVAIDQLSGKVAGQSIPDQSGESKVAIGKVKYWVTGMKVTSFNKPSSRVTVAPKTGLTWSVTGISAKLHGDWRYEFKKAFIKIKDHGSFDVDITASITVSVTLGKDGTGHPTIRTTNCNSDISHLNVKFHGGASWLYNLFSSSIEHSLKGALNKMLCKSVDDEVNNDANAALAKMKVLVPLNNLGELDYSLTQVPSFTTTYIESYHKGEIFWKGDKTEAPVKNPTINDPPLDGMISFLASDYILNTAGYVLQKHGILKYDLTRKDLPDANKDLLNTTCTGNGQFSLVTCIGMFITQLKTMYPKSLVEIALATSEAPTLEIESSGLRGHFVGQAVFTVRTPDGKSHPAFTLDLDVGATITVQLDGQIIKAQVTKLTPTFKITDSKIGNISEISVSFLFGIIETFAMKQLNEVGKKGMPLPKIDNVNYVNPKITLVKDGIHFATDIKYAPSSTLYFKSGAKDVRN